MILTKEIRELLILKLKQKINNWNTSLQIINDEYNLDISDDHKTLILLCKLENIHISKEVYIRLFIFKKINNNWSISNNDDIKEYNQYKISSLTPVLLSKDNSKVIIGLPTEDKVIVYGIDSEGKIILRNFLRGNRVKSKDMFGFSVGINNDASIIVVGSPYSSIDGFPECGVVYVFKFDKDKQDYEQIGRMISSRAQYGYRYLGNKIESREVTKDRKIYQEFYISDSYWKWEVLLDENGAINIVSKDTDKFIYIDTDKNDKQ